MKDMKKIIGISIIAILVAAMVLLLFSNRRRMLRQTAETTMADRTEVVGTYHAREEEYTLDFSANGVTQAVSELNYVSDISGRVTAIYVDKGSRVQKGTPLLKVDTELYEADYKASKTAYETLKKDESRLAQSNMAGGVSDQQLDNIRTQLIAAESRMTASRWKYENSVVKAPLPGTVNNRYVEIGSLIAPNTPLFEIVNDRSLKVTVNVPESRLGMLYEGMPVKAADSSLPGVVFTGKVGNIGMKTDRGLNYPVEIMLDRNDALKIGMYLRVQFTGGASSKGILLPRKCIVGSTMSANVYVVIDGKALRREVSLGEMVGDRIEVSGGIGQGDEVIESGLMNISDGSAVKVINK